MKKSSWIELIFGWLGIAFFGFVFVSLVPTLSSNGSYELRFIFACSLLVTFIVWFCYIRIKTLIWEIKHNN